MFGIYYLLNKRTKKIEKQFSFLSRVGHGAVVDYGVFFKTNYNRDYDEILKNLTFTNTLDLSKDNKKTISDLSSCEYNDQIGEGEHKIVTDKKNQESQLKRRKLSAEGNLPTKCCTTINGPN